jgi:ethanolamine permease
VVGEHHPFYHLLIGIGLCGLVASFHGIILCAGRATFEFGRVGYAPRIFGKILPKRGTPAAALVLNMLIGFVALLTGKTGDIIAISVFGALTLYIISMLSVLKLRKDRPAMTRPYRTPFYPYLPFAALSISVICLVSMTYFNPQIALIYLGLLAMSYLWFHFGISKTAKDAVRQPA